MNLLTKLKIEGKALTWTVWLLRLTVGGVFIMSGLVKSIDLWGFSFKIEEYFLAWNVDMPRSLYLIIAVGLSVLEFMLGSMLAMGCYKWSSSWLLLAMMGVMLPLSLYIYVADPVADCGCFGDFWIISNGATFVKNIFLTLALVFLSVYNKRVKGVFNPYIQWTVGAVCLVYIVAIAMWGYMVQPLLDFRSFPVGSQIIVDQETQPDVKFEFIYEKDGVKQSFTEEALPDSTWTFVDRRIVSGSIDDRTELAVYDGDEDVTEDVVATDGDQMLIVVPDYKRANISYTFAINELKRYMDSIGGDLIEIAAIPDEAVDQWRDLSMATYPIYKGESTVLKELARGVIAAVYVHDGRIVWKRSLPSVDLDFIENAKDKRAALAQLTFDGSAMLWSGSLALMAILAVILLLDNGRRLLKWRKKRSALEKNCVNLCQNKSGADAPDSSVSEKD